VAERAVICEPVSTSDSLLTGKLTGNFAISTVLEAILQPKVSVPQQLLAEFPVKINRENFADIRDRNRDIRVIYWHYVSVHFSHTFLVARKHDLFWLSICK
jgi:hypothetical protein